MHQHIAHPPTGPESSTGVLDNISDTLLNAFAKLRKPDERFLAMRDGVDKSEEGLHSSERIWNRLRSRTSGEYSLHALCRALLVLHLSEAEEMVTLNLLVKTYPRIITISLLRSKVLVFSSLVLRIH